MSTDLTKVDESRPEGLRDRIPQDPARQRLTRSTLVENFAVEHHLTGEHKIPNGDTFDREAAQPGQLFLHDDGLLMHGNSVFPVGTVRLLTNAAAWMWGRGINVIGIGSEQPIYAGPAFDNWQVGGFAPYAGLPLNALVGGIAGAKIGAFGNGQTNTRFGQFARLEFPAGVYELSGVVRYVTGASGVGSKSATLKFIDADDQTVIEKKIANLETAAHDATDLSAHGRLEIEPFGFTVETADYLDLHLYGSPGNLNQGPVTSTQALAVIGTAIKVRRVA